MTRAPRFAATPPNADDALRELLDAAREALPWLDYINRMAAARVEIRLHNAIVACEASNSQPKGQA